jgi:hypothetical protein
MNEDFWYKIWRLVAIGTCMVVVTIAGSCGYSQYLVASSDRPLAVSCAIGMTASPTSCAIVEDK